jgi:hypothetical protein
MPGREATDGALDRLGRPIGEHMGIDRSKEMCDDPRGIVRVRPQRVFETKTAQVWIGGHGRFSVSSDPRPRAELRA